MFAPDQPDIVSVAPLTFGVAHTGAALAGTARTWVRGSSLTCGKQKADAECQFVCGDWQSAVAPLPRCGDGIAEYSLLVSEMSNATGDRHGAHPEGTEPHK